MILRRFSEAIAQKDWFTVTIELTILIVGIFLGLQVDDWNEARKDRNDEQQIVERLHDDVMLADQLTLRIRDRLLGRLDHIKDASERLFDNAPPENIDTEMCSSIAATSLTAINTPRLAAFDELVGTGRLDILQNAELLHALISLEQYRAALASLVNTTSSEGSLVFLPAAFPELLRVNTYLEPDTGEIRISVTCDAEAMRASQAFLNQFSYNADTYDVFIRDGLQPWNEQFSRVHAILDGALGIEH
jgi:hypothetical protein